MTTLITQSERFQMPNAVAEIYVQLLRDCRNHKFIVRTCYKIPCEPVKYGQTVYNYGKSNLTLGNAIEFNFELAFNRFKQTVIDVRDLELSWRLASIGSKSA